MTYTGLLLLALTALSVDVELKPLAGPPLSGKLAALGAAGATLETADGPQTFALADLLNITFPRDPKVEKTAAAAWVELVDGSLLLASGYTAVGGEAVVQMAGHGELKLSTSFVRSVRWADQNDELAGQWRQIGSGVLNGDAVVVRRTPTSLDHWEGVTYEVSPESVQFELDGQRVAIPRQRLEGLIYYRPALEKVAAASCRVTDRNGSQWSAQSLQLEPGSLRVTTAAGAQFVLSLDELQGIDFSSGNLVFLSDLEPTSVQWTPYFAASADGRRLAKLFEPRRDQSFDGGKLQLGEQTYEKGLAVHSRTELVYRLTEDFRRFQAVVGIDDRVREGGDVKLIISDGRRTLFEQAVTGTQPPLEVDLDVSGVQRLVILVDFGAELDIADHLDLCDARLMK